MYVKMRHVVGYRKWGSICVLRRQTPQRGTSVCHGEGGLNAQRSSKPGDTEPQARTPGFHVWLVHQPAPQPHPCVLPSDPTFSRG